jgi:L-lactate dehydrogenase complex protein LldF
MPVDTKAPYRERIRQALSDKGLRIALDRATAQLSERRTEAIAAIDNESLRDEARGIREHSIENLPHLLRELEGNLVANGCHVHWARDAAEARSIVLDIAVSRQARHVVKSKSMVTEEIGLNDALEQSGIAVVESDLGEFIVQLAGEPPSHIIAPVIHKRVEDIDELFQRKLGTTPTNDPGRICAVARRELRREFLRADIGISGCNFAIAETGTICVITNEGNGRMVTSLPRVYIAVAGIEKVVPTVEEAVLLWQVASRNATGQEVSVYFSLSSGPRRPGHTDGPDEMHVVLLDNGRSRMLQRGYADAALCIRCGACVNVCPVYREIGGHAYGHTPYSGPIGAVTTPLLADDMRSAGDLPYASSLCGLCRDACPVKIDLPRLLLDLRSDLVDLRSDLVAFHPAPALERKAIAAYSAAAQTPRRFRQLQRLGRWITRLPFLSLALGAWTRTRTFPRFAPKPFSEIWRAEGSSGGDEA